MKGYDATTYEETRYGFTFGAAKVERWISHHGYVVVGVTTPRQTLRIQVTPTGLIRTSVAKTRKEAK